MGVPPQFHLPHMIKFRHGTPLGKNMARFHRHHKQPVRVVVPPEESEQRQENKCGAHKNKVHHVHRPHRHHRASKGLEHLHEKLPSSHRSTRLHRHQKRPVYTVVLPEEAQKLKEKILRTHRVKFTHFSLSHMKTIIVPPVEIPRKLINPRAQTMIVAGRNVPLTRCMWNDTKRKLHHLERIPESSAALHAFPTRQR